VLDTENMPSTDPHTLKRIVALIERGECLLAVETWSNHRRERTKCCDRCPYEGMDLQDCCALCLEAKLRTLSLYIHDHSGFDQILLNAARMLDAFRQNALQNPV